jgi:hypothetical protein
MSDWNSEDIGFQSADRSGVMIRPPFSLVAICGGIALVSAFFLLGTSSNSSIGYGISVVASIGGGITALIDQKRRGDSNYLGYDSFRWIMIAVRYGVLLIAAMHILRLAINAANGGSLFG